jgi:hypothetical protein
MCNTFCKGVYVVRSGFLGLDRLTLVWNVDLILVDTEQGASQTEESLNCIEDKICMLVAMVQICNY